MRRLFTAHAEIGLGALEAVARAVEHVADQRTAIPETESRAVALGHAPGRYTPAEMDEAIGKLATGGELKAPFPVEQTARVCESRQDAFSATGTQTCFSCNLARISTGSSS